MTPFCCILHYVISLTENEDIQKPIYSMLIDFLPVNHKACVSFVKHYLRVFSFQNCKQSFLLVICRSAVCLSLLEVVVECNYQQIIQFALCVNTLIITVRVIS